MATAGDTRAELLDTQRPAPAQAPTPRWRKLLLTVHISAAAGLIGADLVLLVLGITGLRGADPQTVYPAMSLLGSWVLAPLAITALTTGLTQAIAGGWGLLRYWWVAIKLAITAVLTGLVLVVVVPGLGRAADAATGPAAQQILTDAQRTLYVITPSITLALLVTMVALAVYKPGWRLRTGGRR